MSLYLFKFGPVCGPATIFLMEKPGAR